MPLEVRRMRHVVALADHGSFARAAAALGLSQPALSRSIQAVERETGSRLFVRTPTGVEQTDAGRVFVSRIRQILELTESLDRDMSSERGLQSGYVHLGAGPYPAYTSVADGLARFVSDFPRVVVRVILRDWDELLRRLRAREIELFVAETSTFGSENDIEIEPMEPHPGFLLARPGHPLAGRDSVSFTEGLAYPFVALSRLPPRSFEPIRALQRRLPDPSVADRAFPAIEFSALDAARRIVLGSNALMVAPLTCVEHELRTGRLVAIGFEPYLRTNYGIVKLKTHPHTAAAARLRAYLIEAERAVTERERELLEWWRSEVAKPRGDRSPARSADPTASAARRPARTARGRRPAADGGRA